jgi:hypothetical protein
MPWPKNGRRANAYVRSVVGRDARAARNRRYDEAHPPLRHGGGFNCWCGESLGHDWPGRADGAPHPREGR